MDKSMHLPHIKAILYLQVAFEALMWSTSHFFFQCHFQRIPVYLTLTFLLNPMLEECENVEISHQRVSR